MNKENTKILYQSAEDTRKRLEKRPTFGATPLNRELKISFEFFPPTTSVATKTFLNTIDQLAPLKPEFSSVTYGAGGSSQGQTLETVRYLENGGLHNAAAHLTCVGASRVETNGVIDSCVENGIRHIIALRGDSPDHGRGFVPHPDGYINATDLVGGIRRQTRGIDDFEISVAAYPEVHPDSQDAKQDLDNLKRKIDAGANRAITQFFFEPDAFLRFRDAAYKAGITAPIVPGILPVTNFGRVVEFARRCGTAVPPWMSDLFAGLDDAPDLRQMVATTVTAELCTRLIDNGVNVFHFYTLNRPELTHAICHILGVRPQGSMPSAKRSAEI